MPRIDKYDPYNGGFRAPLAADWPAADAVAGKVYGVGLNASGQVVKGAGVTGILGVLCLTQNKNLKDASGTQVPKHKAGEPVDVMTSGEIIQWSATDGTAGVAGTNYYAVVATGNVVAGTGAGGTTQPATSVPIGTTVEGGRLVVRYSKITASA